MSTNKYINIFAAVLMAIVVIITAVFTGFSNNEEFVDAFSYSAECTYEDLFDPYEVMEIEISMAEEDFEAMLENPTAEEYKQCNITVNGENYANVAIRTKGNTSLSQVATSDSDRYSFKVEFDHYDSGQSMQGLDKLVLNNLFCDATYIKEYIAYDIFDYIEVECPYYTFAHITINGEEWGLYLALEAMEDSFVERVYGTVEGELYKPESMEQPQMGEAPKGMEPPQMEELPEGVEMPQMGELPEGMEFPQMDDFAGKFGGSGGGSDLVYTDDSTESYSSIFDNASFEPTDEDKEAVIEALKNLSAGENLEQYFDVDACLRYFAAQTFIVNMDSYYSNLKHNYYLYEEEGQLTILPWDLNLAFGGFQASGATDAVNNAIDTPMGGSLEESRPLFSKLMEVEEYKELYHQYLGEIVTGYVGGEQFNQSFKTITSVIDSYVQKDATAFYDYDEYTEAIKNLEQFVLLRAASVEGQLNGTIPATTQAQKDCDTLIDTSNVDLSAMGTQGGDGAGGRGSQGGHMFGNPGKFGHDGNFGQFEEGEMSGMEKRFWKGEQSGVEE